MITMGKKSVQYTFSHFFFNSNHCFSNLGPVHPRNLLSLGKKRVILYTNHNCVLAHKFNSIVKMYQPVIWPCIKLSQGHFHEQPQHMNMWDIFNIMIKRAPASFGSFSKKRWLLLVSLSALYHFSTYQHNLLTVLNKS